MQERCCVFVSKRTWRIPLSVFPPSNCTMQKQKALRDQSVQSKTLDHWLRLCLAKKSLFGKIDVQFRPKFAAFWWTLTTCGDIFIVAIRDVSDLQNTPITVIDASSTVTLPVMDIISTIVPSLFTQKYAEMILSGALPPSQWPILAVIRLSELDSSSLDQNQDQCGLYVMREKAIQLVHKYQGTR